MTRWKLIAFLLVIAVSSALTWYKVPVASSQGTTITAVFVSGDLPLDDPGARVWDRATAVDIPLSAQNAAEPMLLEPSIRSLRVSALHNGSDLALMVTWADATQDVEMVRVEDFRDAVAVQFPLQSGDPFFCMGQVGGDVNIWHWKADWQADLIARRDMETAFPNMAVNVYPFTETEAGEIADTVDYTDPAYVPAMALGNLFAAPSRLSPVEDLMSGGFGSLTAQPADSQNVSGMGVWSDGAWTVIFHRALISTESYDVTLRAGAVHSVAFAAWDGSNEERDGLKSTSQWVSLQLLPTPGQAAAPAGADPQGSFEPYIFVVGPAIGTALLFTFVVAGGMALLILTRRRDGED